MGIDDELRSELVRGLATAYRSRQAVRPLTERHPEIDLDDAYEIQRRQVASWVEDGRVVRGHKVGLTSSVMQRQLGVDQPDYGVLMDDFFHLEHLPIATENYLQPKVEPEIAFVLRKDLSGPGVNVAEAIDAVEWVLPSLEIIDSRISDWNITFFDTIADNASSGGVVLGSTPRRISELDLRMLGVVLRVNGAIVETGAGAAVLGSPINALVWLANVLGGHGESLRAGQVVLPGSVTRAIPVTAGNTVDATFAGLGTVTARFS